jgi:hypothetical protein
LPNSVSVTLTGVGHGTFFRGCMPKMMSAFIDEPDPTTLERGCAARMGPFPAFVDAMGPPP